jgi:hypothetical protein
MPQDRRHTLDRTLAILTRIAHLLVGRLRLRALASGIDEQGGQFRELARCTRERQIFGVDDLFAFSEILQHLLGSEHLFP